LSRECGLDSSTTWAECVFEGNANPSLLRLAVRAECLAISLPPRCGNAALAEKNNRAERHATEMLLGIACACASCILQG
jgi:hypothetical protein